MHARFVVVASLTAYLSHATEVTPVQKVTQLLQGLLEKGKKEKHEEEVQFVAYSQWCTDTIDQRQKAIQEGNTRIEALNADIEKYAADAHRLGREVDAHDGEVAGWQSDTKAATAVRTKENTDFIKTEQDYAESVSALARATEVLKAQTHDRTQAKSALLQIQQLVPAASKHVIDAFLSLSGEDDADHLSKRAPEANAYEFQSQGVVEMLEKLSDKFEEELDTLRKEEANKKHAHQMLVQDLKGQIEEGERQSMEKGAARAENLQNKAKASADLSDTTTARDDDQQYLDVTSATCAKKDSDFKNRQQLRADEITAIEKAIEILSSDAVAGTASRHLPALFATSFAQLRSIHKKLAPEAHAQQRVIRYLTQQGNRINSRMLSALAVRAAADPFEKIKQMVEDLITRLMEEANAEAEEKAWCDEELSSNSHTRKEKSARIEKLMASKDELEADIASLSKDITELAQQVSDLDKAVAEARALRAKEKATNAQTIKEAKEAQDAVARALKVLQEFFAKAGIAESFVQQPAIFDSPYQGMQGESKGVIGMLEVIQTDFARLESETDADENASQREHDAFLDTSAIDKAEKTANIEHKTATKKKNEKNLNDTEQDLQGTQKELDKAVKYYDSIKPRCVSANVSYEDRVARRQEEIESLQEALRILSGSDIA
eukprot:GEMP01020051.1.p1 GENE.GEMP01020051.1~~GEMP01020051.1.p1  ORF type:complete len:665 (+),score=284.09 GEMP01020051.1:80-2074(+)